MTQALNLVHRAVAGKVLVSQVQLGPLILPRLALNEIPMGRTAVVGWHPVLLAADAALEVKKEWKRIGPDTDIQARQF